MLTLLDLLDHVREGYFSCVFLSPPDDPVGQLPLRSRSQPLGLDGLCPKTTRIVGSTNQHSEFTARFAQQALLCTAHRVATVLIIPEDLGGHTVTGPPSLWSMTEFQSLEGLDDAHRGAGCSCQLGSAEQGLTTGILSNLSSAFSVLYRGWPQSQPTSAATSSLVNRGPLQKTCSCSSQHTLTDVARLTPLGQGAKFGQPRVTRHDRLHTHHSPLLQVQVLFIVFWGSGSRGTSREVLSAHSLATSSSTASSISPLPRQLWREGGLLFLHAAPFPIGPLLQSPCHPLLRVLLVFLSSWKVRESARLLGLRILDGNRPS